MLDDYICWLCQNKTMSLGACTSLRRCIACGLWHRDNSSSDRLNNVYKLSWHEPGLFHENTDGTSLSRARLWVARLCSALGIADMRGKAVLDYGAGWGNMSIAFAERGAQVWAVDPYSFITLREKVQLRRAYRTLDEIPINVTFHGIATCEVIEHLENPRDVLFALRQRLEPGGWLFLTTPSVDGLRARLTRSNWREAQKQTHLNLFSPCALSLLLSSSGFYRYKRLNWHEAQVGPRRLLSTALSLLGLQGSLRVLAWLDGSDVTYECDRGHRRGIWGSEL